MEDLENLDSLQQQNIKILDENKKTQEARNVFKQEYVKLKDQLSTLTDKVSYPTILSVGGAGFFQGELIHTNELMVLLGDNWFVERSAKQACQIIERRIELIDKQLADLKKEHDNFQSHGEFTNHFQQIKDEYGGIKEIKEELPSSYEKNKGKRIARQPKHNQTPKPVKFDTDSTNYLDNPLLDTTDQSINHNELLARLNELEKQEEAENQLELEAKMNEIMKGNSKNSFSSQIKDECDRGNLQRSSLSEQHHHQGHLNLEENVTDTSKRVKFVNDTINTTENRECLNTNTIQFAHTPNNQKILDRERSASDSDVRNSFAFIKSPSDIYEQFRLKDEDADKPLKSILKKDSRSNSTENLKLRPILKTSPEHRPDTPEQMFDDPRPILKTPPDTEISDMRPITPEYADFDEPRPILKSSFEMSERLQFSEYLNGDPRSILKSNETLSSDDYKAIQSFTDPTNDEVKSILKCNPNESTVKVLPTPEEDRKSILKSPSKLRESCLSDSLSEPQYSLEKRAILKNTISSEDAQAFSENVVERAIKDDHERENEQAFSQNVVERNMDVNNERGKEQPPKSSKPMSKFKASRKKK